jgi:hypothetical protein
VKPTSTDHRQMDDPALLRVSMPVPSTEDVAYKRPAGLRLPHQFDRRPVPRCLKGDTLEAGRRVVMQGDFSLLTAQQLLEAVRVQVHVKLPHPAAGASDEQGTGVDAAMQRSTAQHSEVAIRLGLPDIRRPPSRTQSAAGGQQVSATSGGAAPQHASSGASASLATSLRGRTFNTHVYKASAATFKNRARGGGRALGRSLTEALWDDSHDALEQLTGKLGADTVLPACEDAHAADQAPLDSETQGIESSTTSTGGGAGAGTAHVVHITSPPASPTRVALPTAARPQASLSGNSSLPRLDSSRRSTSPLAWELGTGAGAGRGPSPGGASTAYSSASLPLYPAYILQVRTLEQQAGLLVIFKLRGKSSPGDRHLGATGTRFYRTSCTWTYAPGSTCNCQVCNAFTQHCSVHAGP